jgi:hypothetical protein
VVREGKGLARREGDAEWEPDQLLWVAALVASTINPCFDIKVDAQEFVTIHSVGQRRERQAPRLGKEKLAAVSHRCRPNQFEVMSGAAEAPTYVICADDKVSYVAIAKI